MQKVKDSEIRYPFTLSEIIFTEIRIVAFFLFLLFMLFLAFFLMDIVLKMHNLFHLRHTNRKRRNSNVQN